MNRKTVSGIVLTLIIASTLCVAFNVAPVLTEEPTEDYSSIDSRYFVDDIGTYFEITGSTYLNITLTSSERVHVIFESIPMMISLFIERDSSATSTILAFSGFEADTTYYRYHEGFLIENFTTDSSGGYTYTQDISESHYVDIQENSSTLYITSDYTFTSDIYEPIVVAADNVVIDGNGHTLQGSGTWRGFGLWDRHNVTIKNMIVKGWSQGVLILQNSSYITILNNTVVSNHDTGIDMRDSTSSIISNNVISNNGHWGILSLVSRNNTISANTVSNNGWDAPDLWGAGMFIVGGGNTLRNNNMTCNIHNFGVSLALSPDISLLEDFINDIDTSNTVDGKPIYYLINQNNLTVDSTSFPEIGYLALVNSTGIAVRDLALTNNMAGIFLAYTTYSVIENVEALNNWRGIELVHSGNNIIRGNILANHGYGVALWKDSDENTICDNIISSNRYGASLFKSNWNTIYHNNFINNTQQVLILKRPPPDPLINTWDDGYPSGGNYWSDYAGADLYRGPNQDQSGSDGIGDTPYVVDETNQDNYPLMSHWTPLVGPIDVDPDVLNLKSNGEWITAYIELPERYNVEDIGISTVMLNNTVSVDLDAPTQIGDYDLDGMADLMVKFDRASIIEWLGTMDYSEDTGKSYFEILTITGTVLDMPFEGSDTIKVLHK